MARLSFNKPKRTAAVVSEAPKDTGRTKSAAKSAADLGANELISPLSRKSSAESTNRKDSDRSEIVNRRDRIPKPRRVIDIVPAAVENTDEDTTSSRSARRTLKKSKSASSIEAPALITSKKAKCINCSKFLTCRDPEKVVMGYSCDRFKRAQVAQDNISLLPDGYADVEPELTLEEQQQIALAEELGDNFIAEAMAKAYDPKTNTIRDLRIDDSALPMAKNFFDFAVNLIGSEVKPPFARQMWIAYNLLSEWCPRCTKPRWYEDISNIPVDMDPRHLIKKVAFLEYGVCPYCNVTKYELIKAGELHERSDLVFMCGQRAGKTALATMILAYYTHLLIKSPPLSTLCSGIQSYSPLTASMTAVTLGQALKGIWKGFKSLLSISTWYQELFHILDVAGEASGKELYQFNPATGMYARFFHRNIEISPSGPSKRTLRGDTRYLAAQDELSYFPFKITEEDGDDDEERERANADEVYQAMVNSLATVQAGVIEMRGKGINHIPMAANLAISSPFSWLDKTCRLFTENADNPNALCVQQPTWAISPLYTREHPIIVQAYRRNAKKAERDFGANPPKIGSDWYNREITKKCFTLEPWYSLEYDLTAADLVKASLISLRRRLRYHPSVVALDAGVNNNAFALTVTYRAGSTIHVPVCLEIVPQQGRTLHYPSIYKQIILPIMKTCNAKALVADRFNSLQLLQQAKDDVKDLQSGQYSVTMRDFRNVLQLVETESILFPRMDLQPENVERITNYKRDLLHHPADHLYLQCMTVQELGGTIMKGTSAGGIRYTDDLHRAMVLGVAAVTSEKVGNYLAKFRLVDVDEAIGGAPRIIVTGRSSMFTAGSSLYGRGQFNPRLGPLGGISGIDTRSAGPSDATLTARVVNGVLILPSAVAEEPPTD